MSAINPGIGASSFRTPENDALAAEFVRQNAVEEQRFLQIKGAALGQMVLEVARGVSKGHPKTVVPMPLPTPELPNEGLPLVGR
jgi:hypothetical protein